MRLKMKIFYKCALVFCIFTSLFADGQSKEKVGFCAIKHENGQDFSEYLWEDGVDLTEILDTTPSGENILHYKTGNINSVVKYTVNGNEDQEKYVKVNLGTEKVLTIDVGDGFKVYEDYETKEEITIKVFFKCSDNNTRDISFKVPIEDTNNHDPEFLNAPYKYELPMPIPKGFSLGYLKPVIAKDVDLSNKRITFNFDAKDTRAADFSISSIGRNRSDIKQYLTAFTTTATLDFEDDTTVVLYATDSGQPQRTSQTNLTIVVDKANSYPRFSHPLYVANLTTLDYKKEKNITLKFTENKTLTLDRGYADVSGFEIKEISKENEKHFKLSHSKRTSDNVIVIQVNLVNITKEFVAQEKLSVILSAIKNQMRADTVLQIILPEVEGKVVVPEKVNCDKNLSTKEDDSTNGYMVATILLSLTVVGLIAYLGYLYVYRR